MRTMTAADLCGYDIEPYSRYTDHPHRTDTGVLWYGLVRHPSPADRVVEAALAYYQYDYEPAQSAVLSKNLWDAVEALDDLNQ